MCNFEKHIDDFLFKKIQNVEFVVLKETWNVTMRIKINYQITERCAMKVFEKNWYRNKMIDINTSRN